MLCHRTRRTLQVITPITQYGYNAPVRTVTLRVDGLRVREFNRLCDEDGAMLEQVGSLKRDEVGILLTGLASRRDVEACSTDDGLVFSGFLFSSKE